MYKDVMKYYSLKILSALYLLEEPWHNEQIPHDYIVTATLTM